MLRISLELQIELLTLTNEVRVKGVSSKAEFYLNEFSDDELNAYVYSHSKNIDIKINRSELVGDIESPYHYHKITIQDVIDYIDKLKALLTSLSQREAA